MKISLIVLLSFIVLHAGDTFAFAGGATRAGQLMLKQIVKKAHAHVVKAKGKKKFMASLAGISQYEAGLLLKRSVKLRFFNGKVVAQDSKLFKPNGFNIERMKKGQAPLGKDGKSIELHHLKQDDKGTIMEMQASVHRGENFKILHRYCKPSGKHGETCSTIDREGFEKFKKAYWKDRAQDLGYY